MGTKVFWTEVEFSKVVKRIKELLTKNPELGLLNAARRAQIEVLPLSRQRKLISLHNCAKIIEVLNEEGLYKKEPTKRGRPFKKDISPIVEEPSIEPKVTEQKVEDSNFGSSLVKHSSETTPFALPELDKVLAEQMYKILKVSVDSAIEMVKQNVLEQLKEAIISVKNEIPYMLTDHVEEVQEELKKVEVPKINKEPKVSKARVVILGLWDGAQSQLDTKEYPNLDIKMCKEIGEVRRMSNHKDLTLIQMVRFSAHLPKDIKLGMGRIAMCNGGYSHLRRQLNVMNTAASVTT